MSNTNTVTTNMPLDANGNAVQALALKPGGAQQIPATITSARIAAAFSSECRVVTLIASADMYIEFGDDTVLATVTSHFLKAGIYRDFVVNDGNDLKFSKVAAIMPSATGILYVSERL